MPCCVSVSPERNFQSTSVKNNLILLQRTNWWVNVALHREDGPTAYVAINTPTNWWVNVAHHREDGPVIIF